MSIGIQDSVDELLERVEIERAAGYRRVKIKIKPGWDIDAVGRIRDRFGDVPLMVDANAAYTIDDEAHLAGLDDFDLMMIEQPLDYDDLRDHARLQRRLRTDICLDESIDSVRAGDEAIAMGACRIINIKPGRVGGHAASIRLHDLAASHGIPVWHGGMLESGIGRAHNIHLSTLPNFSLPGDVAASRRYYAPDLIDPEIVVRSDGTIAVPDGPGIGIHVVADRMDAATQNEWSSGFDDTCFRSWPGRGSRARALRVRADASAETAGSRSDSRPREAGLDPPARGSAHPAARAARAAAAPAAGEGQAPGAGRRAAEAVSRAGPDAAREGSRRRASGGGRRSPSDA